MSRHAPIVRADGIPVICTVADICRVLQISRSQFFALRRAGRFPIPEMAPRIDHRPRFAGEAVAAYIQRSMCEVSA